MAADSFISPSNIRLNALGDSAVIVYCDDEALAASFALAVRRAEPAWLIDVVVAYSSVAVFFDLRATCFADASSWLQQLNIVKDSTQSPRRFVIPCCYELALDLDRVSGLTGLSIDEVIGQHSMQEYRVFAIGFCPGFPYMGYLREEISGIPRLDAPRVRVEPGSVGLTGRQTGIYPMERPGGWNIIGRTPMALVDLEAGFFALTPGDVVHFEAIDLTEYRSKLGQRLLPLA